MSIEITILGCSAATPRENHAPTSQVININGNLFLIDCGEGTQTQLIKYKINFCKINYIFISHLHGDHFFGLIGLISSFHLLGRKNPVTVFSPKGLKEIIQLQLKISQTNLSYDLIFKESENTITSEKIFETNKIEVFTIPLKHRIPTVGYLFKETTKSMSIKKELIEKYELSIDEIKSIKNGDDFISKNNVSIPNKEMTIPPEGPYSYAFCSDTVFTEDYLEIIKDTDMLYHESTFLENEIERAKKTFHCTAKQAATIAKKSNIRKLILGHFSQRYKNVDLFLQEAKEIFENTELAKDGKKFKL